MKHSASKKIVTKLPASKPAVKAITKVLQTEINNGFEFVVNSTVQACTGKSQMTKAIKAVCQSMSSLTQAQIKDQVSNHLSDMIESITDSSATATELNEDTTVNYKLWLKNHASTLSAFRNTFSNNLELVSNAPDGKKWTLRQIADKANAKIWTGKLELVFTDKKVRPTKDVSTTESGGSNDLSESATKEIVESDKPLPKSDIAHSFEGMNKESQRLLLIEMAKTLKLSPAEAVKALCGVTVQIVNTTADKKTA